MLKREAVSSPPGSWPCHKHKEDPTKFSQTGIRPVPSPPPLEMQIWTKAPGCRPSSNSKAQQLQTKEKPGRNESEASSSPPEVLETESREKEALGRLKISFHILSFCWLEPISSAAGGIHNQRFYTQREGGGEGERERLCG